MQLIEVNFTKLILKEILVTTSVFFLKQKEETQRWKHVLGAAGLNSKDVLCNSCSAALMDYTSSSVQARCLGIGRNCCINPELFVGQGFGVARPTALHTDVSN